jgi:hypothetical protein
MYSLWKEEDELSLQWLDTKEPKSVQYVSFGSVIVIASEQLVLEFAMGLANSNHFFCGLYVRPDLVIGNSAILPAEFEVETKKRGFFAN